MNGYYVVWFVYIVSVGLSTGFDADLLISNSVEVIYDFRLIKHNDQISDS